MITTLGKIDELKFNESSHIYKLHGFELPSVTTLMNPLSSDLYSDIPEDVLTKAAERGTAVHDANEMYNKFGIEDIEHEYQGYFDAFKKWCEFYKPRTIANEYRMYHKTMLYAGTADTICDINGRLVLIDYKTSASINEMLTGVQLEAYAQALSTHGVYVDAKAIVHLTSSGKYNMKIYEANDTDSWTVFVSLLTIHNYKLKYARRR